MDLATLKAEAEVTLRPLAAKMATAEKQLAALHKRAEGERGDVASHAAHLAALKGAAGTYATGQNEYASFKVKLKRKTADLEAAREALGVLEGELIPAAQRELDAATMALQSAARRFYAAAVPAVEVRLTALLDQVVGELDNFETTFEQLSKDYGTAFNGEPPHAAHVRIYGTDRYGTGGLVWVTFTPPATSPAAAVLTQPAPAESAPTGEKALGVAEARPLPPEAAATVNLDTLDAPDALDAKAPPEAGKDIPQSAADSA